MVAETSSMPKNLGRKYLENMQATVTTNRE